MTEYEEEYEEEPEEEEYTAWDAECDKFDTWWHDGRERNYE